MTGKNTKIVVLPCIDSPSIAASRQMELAIARNAAAALVRSAWGQSASLNIPMPNIAILVSNLIHLLGGAAILVGYQIRWAAAALALLCLGTAFGVHLPAGDTANMANFYKNLVMAGGFLYVINFGAGAISVDEGVR